MKTLKRIAAVLAMSGTLFISTPLMAQNDPNNNTASSGRDSDNDHNWGWVGLIGLLGLLGLKRKDDRRTANYSTANTGGNR
jgi:hypothetical protein